MVTPLAVFLNDGLLNEIAPEMVKASPEIDAVAVDDTATVAPSTDVLFSLVDEAEYRLCRLAP